MSQESFPSFSKQFNVGRKNSRKKYMLITAPGQERGVLEKSIEHEDSDAPVLPGPKVRESECLGPGDMWKVGDMFYIQCCMNIDASHLETVNIWFFFGS